MIETGLTYLRNMIAKVEVTMKDLYYEQYLMGMYHDQAVELENGW